MPTLSVKSGIFALAALWLGMTLLGCADPNRDQSDPAAAAIDWSDWPDLQSQEKEEVKQCLQGSAERDDSHQPGNTPLHCAAWIGAADIVTTLLDADADVHAVNDDGQSPLHYAITGNMIRKHRAGIPLGAFARHSEAAIGAQGAIEGDYALIVSLLADAGADLDRHDAFGLTPLHNALVPCLFDLVQALVIAGSDVQIPRRGRSQGHTPLHIAAWHACSEAIPLLIAAGAKVNSQEISSTPLHHAVEYSGDPETVTALLHHGANVNAIGGYNDKTPLDLALWSKDNYLAFLAEESDVGYRQRIEDEGYRRQIEKMVVDYENIISMLTAAGGKTAENLLKEMEAGAAKQQ